MKAVLIFAAGVAVGVAATFFAVKGKFEKECEQRVEEAWTDAQEHYKKAVVAKERALKNRKAKEAAKESEEASAVKEEKPQPVVDIKGIRKKAMEARKSYSRNVFTNPPTERDINPEDFDEPGQDEEDDYADPPREGINETPYPITSDQFANEHRFSYDKVTIYVYKDDIVIDERDKTVDDFEQCIGKENVSMLEELADEDGIVLIRNEMRSTDYEIYLMDETYIPEAGVPVKED